MKPLPTKASFSLVKLVCFLLLATNCTNQEKSESDMSAPIAERKDTTLTIHGHNRVDPYYWLRDRENPKVISYLESENNYTNKLLKHTSDLQNELFEEMKGRIKEKDQSAPTKSNGYWYYSRYEEGKEYPIYCRKKETLEAEEEIILDANKMAEGHDYFNAAGLEVSPDNKLLAFGVDTVSRRQYSLHIKNLETGEILPVSVTNTAPGYAWADDNETLFYTSQNTETLLTEKIYRHNIHEQNDILVYEEKDTSFYIGVYREKTGKYIIIWNSSTTTNDFHLLESKNPKGDFIQFTERRPGHEYNITPDNGKFWILSNDNAINFKLMSSEKPGTTISEWKTELEHRDDVLLENLEVFSKHIVLEERSGGLSHILVKNKTSKEIHEISFDENAYIAGIDRNDVYETNILRFYYGSLTTPFSRFDYNMDDKSRTLIKQQEVLGGYKKDDYKTERIFVKSRDGVEIPVSLVYKKGFEKNGNNPLLLYGYGSYGNTIDPYFSIARLSLLDRGFCFAIAHVRGSQINGREWYENGKMFNKQNTFNDFIDVAKGLIDLKYTSREHLYAMGGSAGGLLMGVVINQAPDLFNGVVASVPFVDVVTTMLDESIPLTTNEFDEWGNPKNKDSYEYMLSYSPYDQIEKQDYPNLLVTTGLHDSQVQYWEPAKWVAKLRTMKTDNNLLLLKTNMEAGHGGASGRFESLKETAFEYAFLLDLENKNI
ncbi:S9 family peptidase [Marinigracilibium pacificum]|uniref:Proline-specific endopeptidase n=1 Tax=Marinigracilibium pacificum TaxID=2729599 RepID=A0A848IYL4_9BACT|nr:S9 family peptidase [Marinigracilibium pacificum]NMM48726.1 S9 family peptidase [Marinigracilibium pacificum]